MPLPYLLPKPSRLTRCPSRSQAAEARAAEAERLAAEKPADPSSLGAVSPQAASVVRSAASAVRSAVEDVAEMHTVTPTRDNPPTFARSVSHCLPAAAVHARAAEQARGGRTREGPSRARRIRDGRQAAGRAGRGTVTHSPPIPAATCMFAP